MRHGEMRERVKIVRKVCKTMTKDFKLALANENKKMKRYFMLAGSMFTQPVSSSTLSLFITLINYHFP